MVIMPRRFMRRRRAPMAYPVKLKNQHGVEETVIPTNKAVYVVVNGIAPGAARITGADVPAGGHVYIINVVLNAINTTSADSSSFHFYFAIVRHSQDITVDFPSPDWSDIGLSNVRNQIFYSDLNVIGTEDAGGIKRKFALKVPKIYQRVREGDRLVMIVKTTDNINASYGWRFSSFT